MAKTKSFINKNLEIVVICSALILLLSGIGVYAELTDCNLKELIK